jgi:hypothetical protein
LFLILTTSYINVRCCCKIASSYCLYCSSKTDQIAFSRRNRVEYFNPPSIDTFSRPLEQQYGDNTIDDLFSSSSSLLLPLLLLLLLLLLPLLVLLVLLQELADDNGDIFVIRSTVKNIACWILLYSAGLYQHSIIS